jgi:hypothetical protein
MAGDKTRSSWALADRAGAHRASETSPSRHQMLGGILGRKISSSSFNRTTSRRRPREKSLHLQPFSDGVDVDAIGCWRLMSLCVVIFWRGREPYETRRYGWVGAGDGVVFWSHGCSLQSPVFGMSWL